MAGGLIYQLFDLNYQATVYFRVQAWIARFATGRNDRLLLVLSLESAEIGAYTGETRPMITSVRVSCVVSAAGGVAAARLD